MQFVMPAEQAEGLSLTIADHYRGLRTDDPSLRVMVTIGDGGLVAPPLIVAFIKDDTNVQTFEINSAGTIEEI
jgi:hypothetical protein